MPGSRAAGSVPWLVVIQLLAVLVGVVAGFGGARVLRRPSRTAGAASVGRSVGSAVGTRRDLDLPRLQRSVLSEMMRHVVTRGGVTVVPAAYTVRLHPDDHETVQQAPGFFVQGLEQALAAAGRDHGWPVPTRLRIDLQADPSRKPGAPAVDAPEPAAAPIPPPVAAPPAVVVAAPAAVGPRLERSDGEPPHPLVADTTTLGRGSDRSVRIHDNRASRQHATIARTGGAFTLTDDGSSNGTRLNEAPLPAHVPTVLADGDRIGIGPVVFVFRVGTPS